MPFVPALVLVFWVGGGLVFSGWVVVAVVVVVFWAGVLLMLRWW